MKKFLIGLGILLLVLIIANLVLEPVAKHYVNKELGNLEGYKGSVKDIDIALWRGAYTIEGLNIEKTSSEAPEPFFAANAIDISVEWAALFKGAIVGEVIITEPILNFAVEPSSGEVQAGGDNNWVETVKNLVPIQINLFQIIGGDIHYKDPTAEPVVDIELKKFNVLATNLGNADNNGKLLPSHVSIDGMMSSNGVLDIEIDINPLKETPDFDLTMELKDLELTYLKEFTEAYANFTFKEGQLFLSSEIAMKDGDFEGYVKPVLDNVKIIDLDNEETNFWRKAWEVAIGSVIGVLKNQRTGEFATKVPFSGSVNGTDVSIVATLANVLQNAFIDSFSKNVQGTVDIKDVDNKEDKGFFEELFDGDGKRGEEKAKEDKK